jgi:hypothetical protein
MEAETGKKAMALVAAVEEHAQTLRSVLRRNAGARHQDAIRSILEAHEGYIMACEEELVQREIAKVRSRGRRSSEQAAITAQ